MSVIPKLDGEKIFTPLHNDIPQKWDVIVIGSGIGGMSCASALSKSGKKILLLEQHYLPGGMTHSFTRDGFDWDVGVHVIGEMEKKDGPGKVFHWLTDNNLEMIPQGNPTDRFLYPDGTSFTFPDNQAEFVANLKKEFPGKTERINAYFRIVNKLNEDLFFAFKTLPERVDAFLSALRYKIIDNPWTKTTDEVLKELGITGKLRALLTSQWGYYGATPDESSFAIHAIVQKHFLSGAYYPKGGSKMLAEHILRSVIAVGGQVVTNASVTEILIEDGRAHGVRLENGQEFYAEKIVSGIGSKNTIDKLLPERYQALDWGKNILSLNQSPSYLCLHLGFEGDIKKYLKGSSNLWVYSSLNHDKKNWDFEADEDAPVLYISFPSLKNGKGDNQKHTGEVVTFVSWDPFQKWSESEKQSRPEEYLSFKKDIEQKLINQMKKALPELMEQCVFTELSTPLSTAHYTQAIHGAIYGLEATPKRFACSSLRTRTPIKKLYLTGVDIAGVGVAGGMMGGVLTAASIDPKIYLKLI